MKYVCDDRDPMSSIEKRVIFKVETIHQDILEQFRNDEQLTVLMSHCGFFSQDLINSLAESTEELLIAANEKKNLIKRVFSIFIEGLQNISKHGRLDEDDIQKGILIFVKAKTAYKIVLANIIDAPLEERLINRLNELNGLSETAILELYKEVLERSIVNNSGGAGLGLVTIKMKAKSKLHYNFYPISEDKMLFTLDFHISKNI